MNTLLLALLALSRVSLSLGTNKSAVGATPVVRTTNSSRTGSSKLGSRAGATTSAKPTRNQTGSRAGATSAKPTRNQTAVCIVGGIRSFYYRSVYESILHKAIDRLRPVRVFFVLNKLKSADDNGDGHGKQVKDNVPMGRVRNVLKMFEPTFVEVHEDGDCRSVHEVEPMRLCCDKEVCGFMQLHSVKHCFEEVQRYEAKHKGKFGLYVRLRPDVYYHDFFPPVQTLRSRDVTLAQKWGWNQPADWLFIVTGRGMQWFDEAYADLVARCKAKRSCRYNMNLADPDRESRKKCLDPDTAFLAPEYSSWFAQKPQGTFVTASGARFEFSAIDMGPIIVRTPHKADCFRSLQWSRDCRLQSLAGWDRK